jgi:putative phosphoesterase
MFVISDTHGKTDKALDAYGRLSSVDLIIHLGDVEKDARKISYATGKTVVSVRGNNDFLARQEDFKILKTEFGNILLSHGHIFNVKYDLQRLLYKTLELECRAAFFGHTHIPLFIETDGIYLLNPGSLTYPSDGTSGSYAVATTSSSEFAACIVYL